MGEIRFVGTGETRGYPYPVCKKGFLALQILKGHIYALILPGLSILISPMLSYPEPDEIT